VVRLKDRIEEINKKKKEQLEQQLSEDKKTFFEFVKTFFEEHSEVTAIRWRQYTPSFNDGDPCEFTVGCLYAAVEPLRELQEIGDYDDGFLDSYELRENEKLREDMNCIESFMRNAEVFLENQFGNCVCVTIERGKEPYTKEYYC